MLTMRDARVWHAPVVTTLKLAVCHRAGRLVGLHQSNTSQVRVRKVARCATTNVVHLVIQTHVTAKSVTSGTGFGCPEVEFAGWSTSGNLKLIQASEDACARVCELRLRSSR